MMDDAAATTICKKGGTKCLNELKQYEADLASGDLGMKMSPPRCDDDGFYAAVQCDRGGLCRCVEPDNGEPIFGFEGSEGESIDNGQDCRCARNYYDGLRQGCRMSVGFEEGDKTPEKGGVEYAVS